MVARLDLLTEVAKCATLSKLVRRLRMLNETLARRLLLVASVSACVLLSIYAGTGLPYHRHQSLLFGE